MDWFYLIITDPISNLILGPLIGLLLNWLVMPPRNPNHRMSIRARDISLSQAVTVNQYVSTVHVHGNGGKGGDLDPASVFVAVAIASLAICFLYMWFGGAVVMLTKLLAGVALAFSMATGVRCYLSDRLGGVRALHGLGLPVVSAIFHLWLIRTAEQFVQASASMPRPRSVIDLFQLWTGDQLIWVTMQGFGLVAAMVSLATACFSVVQYLRLQDSTRRHSSKTSIVILAFGLIAWFLVSGTAYRYLQ